MRYLIGILLVFSTTLASAQPENAVVKTIEGKNYYVHAVQAGNTLYGIHKLYNTDLEKILNANPNLTDDLTIGQQILIPIEGAISTSSAVHTVVEGETLYGISKKYNCTVSDLKKVNPGIEEGIQIGQALKIPSATGVGEVIQSDPLPIKNDYQISYSDSVVLHSVLSHETLYSIAKRYMVSTDTIRALNGLRGTKVKKDMILKIPVKKVNYSILEKEVLIIHKDSVLETSEGIMKGTYNVALLLPFMFAKNDIEMSKPVKFGKIKEMYPTTKIAFEFYQGFKLAVDSLKKAGMNVNIYVFDSKRDTATVGKILGGKEFEEMDVVVGPLYPEMVPFTVIKCMELGLRVVLPFKTGPSVLHNNPKVFKAVASNMTLIDGSVDYILKNHAHHNVIILKPYSEGDKALYERAKTRFNEGVAEIKSYNEQIVELSLGSSGGRDLNSYMKKDTVNIVIVPSNDVKFITGAFNRLNKVMNLNPYAKKLKIVAFGFEDWNKINDIDVTHRNRLNQHYSTYRFVDYRKGQGLEFVKAFRAHTGTDPTVYASQGFDVGMYFLSALYMNGTNFENNIEEHGLQLVQNNFRFAPISDGSGYENMCVSVVRYQNFELIECDR